MIIFTPAELRSLAAKCRAEAAEIQKGPISIFAADAVFDENSQAARYERDADELDAAIACNVKTDDDVATLKFRAKTTYQTMDAAYTKLVRSAAWQNNVNAELETYRARRKEHFAALAALLTVTDKLSDIRAARNA